MANDQLYMRRVLRLAKRGEAWVSPNPMVGAVIVKGDRIIGEGYHKQFGGHHAEINAINSAAESVVGATLYVNLEPCTHYGKTPPCTDRIIESRLARVVIGTMDPNPLVSGKGIITLQRHGIETTVGVLEEECRKLNERFFTFIRTGVPFVTLKFAQTIDGRIATVSGQSQWISSEKSLRLAHRLRSTHDAVLVGIHTVIRDDPALTVRLVKGKNPLRVVLDSSLRIPLEAKVLKHQERAKTIIATTSRCDPGKREILQGMGIETLLIEEDSNHRVSLKELLSTLGKQGVSSVLVEGGATIITSLLKEHLSDRVIIVTAPKILGKGIEAVGDLEIRNLENCLKFSRWRIFTKDSDIIIDGTIAKD